jgi:ADP-L-glycero-D-manno-heptose 6-epimerase
MPEDIRGNYQYFTEASMERIRQSGYEKEFWNFHDAIADYVKNYLLPNTYM